MKTATPVSKELVRLLVIEHGHQLASEMSGVPYATVRQWSCRYGWKRDKPSTSQTVTKAIVDSVVDQLAEDERETRLSLARSARRMAKDCEELPVKHADLAKTVAQTMAIVHRQDENKGQSFTLNVLNMGSLGVSVGDNEHDQ